MQIPERNAAVSPRSYFVPGKTYSGTRAAMAESMASMNAHTAGCPCDVCRARRGRMRSPLRKASTAVFAITLYAVAIFAPFALIYGLPISLGWRIALTILALAWVFALLVGYSTYVGAKQEERNYLIALAAEEAGAEVRDIFKPRK